MSLYKYYTFVPDTLNYPIMEQNNCSYQSLKDSVAEPFRTASSFIEKGIYLRFKGKISLQKACAEKSFNTSDIIGELQVLKETFGNSSQNFKNWSLGFLTDYYSKYPS